ncbi:MAG: metallophosphoesterase [Hyphomicrobiales bacterium]|nr:metallophosphoesterase [Hyphomicrobiales bacterium]MDE2018616.1 metallophosphoesterase [Hyphomicrobiales bacterium]
MTDGREDRDGGPSRRKVMECATWIGAGLVWTLAGGVPTTLASLGEAKAEDAKFTFLQISDSHIGFKAPNYQDVPGTLQKVIALAKARSDAAFMIHTGDITHLATPEQFAMAHDINQGAGLAIHHVPGEHDMLDPDKKLYLARHGAGTKGMGWYSFDAGGAHFVGLVNVVETAADGQFLLGAEQLAWFADDLRDKSSSTPIVLFAHVPLWAVYPKWGWGTADAPAAFALLKRFGSVTVLNGHIHQVLQKVEGAVTFHTALSTAFPQPAPGSAPHPGPILEMPADQVTKYLGIRRVNLQIGQSQLATIDTTLA